MTTLDQEQDVVDLAKKLGLNGTPVEAIINRCQYQIDTWVGEVDGVSSVEELEALVASHLNVVFEEVNEDADLDKLKYRYAQKGEFVFAALKDDLSPDTFGTMIRLKDGSHVAVIDCRGDKAARRFFTKWHEIAHLLVDEDFDRQVFRATDEPLERRSLKQKRMFVFDEPEKKLRVRLAVPNKTATEMGLTARWNMRVPESSVIRSAFQNEKVDVSGEENLNTWTFSSGGSLMDCDVFVQARRLDQIVMATIQPGNEI